MYDLIYLILCINMGIMSYRFPAPYYLGDMTVALF